MGLCRDVACVWDWRSAREGIYAHILQGHPNTDLDTFSATVECPWKPSNYRVLGDAAEDAVAAFRRTAWLTGCRGNPALDEMWEGARARL